MVKMLRGYCIPSVSDAVSYDTKTLVFRIFFLNFEFFWGEGGKTVTYLDHNRSEIVITGSQTDKSIEIDRLPFLRDHDNTSGHHSRVH